nr:putative glycosyl hydrolase [synthetic construct]
MSALRTHRHILLEHFNSITAENCMKPASLHPRENEYAFRTADQVADFAARNKKKLRGHTLVWHNQTPDWFFQNGDEPAGREQLLARMADHIATVVGHYKSLAYAWDVVNEAISDDDKGPILRGSAWHNLAGEDYVAYAFRCAHQADPDCVLFYNDYNETRPAKAGRIHAFVRDLLEQGMPVSGIGMQGHYSIYAPSGEEICAAIELYASLGLQLQITELDVSLFAHEDQTAYPSPPEELLAKQADRYEEIFSILRKYKRYITGVTLWGVADDATWLSNFPYKNRKNWPLLFDDDRRPKEASARISELRRQACGRTRAPPPPPLRSGC